MEEHQNHDHFLEGVIVAPGQQSELNRTMCVPKTLTENSNFHLSY